MEVSEGMEIGMIVRLNAAKGYGFISRQDGTDLFFHMSALESKSLFASLVVDQQCQFNVVETAKGKQAMCVVLL